MSERRFNAFFRVFGYQKMEDELMKDSGTESMNKFASNPDEGIDDDSENKEMYNGTAYENAPEGDRKFLKPDETPQVRKDWGREIRIAKTFAPKKIVIGEVYVPYDESDNETIDTHGHACTAEDIEKAAYGFMENMNLQNIDRQHNFESGYGYVVESYIAKEGDPNFKEGSWIMGVKVTDDEVWSEIEKGAITGFSLAGSAILEETKKN